MPNFFLAWESGMWIESSWDILMRALSDIGYWATADREYPSLIKWGQALFSIRYATRPIRWMSKLYDFGVALGKSWLSYAREHINEGSILLHNFERRQEPFPDLENEMKSKNIQLIYIATREWIHEKNISHVFENTFLIGALAAVLNIPYDIIEHALKRRYGKREDIWPINAACLKQWYSYIEDTYPDICLPTQSKHNTSLENKEAAERILLDGNAALALWAIHAGMRCYYAYPMSPSSSILWYIAKTAPHTWVLVKQAEDEISAVTMTIWSMYAWARAMTATSGWWFDLMTETISLSGMTEVPLVCVIVQRPWPATWLPTWTAQGDLNLAIYAGHGEFARIVIAVSDHQSAFALTQHAFNLAEQFQVPVILLSEKAIAENRRIVPKFATHTIPVQRWLVTDPEELAHIQRSERYKITDSWVSKRWLPTTSHTTYFCNGDEHKEDGTLDESSNTKHMIMKRIKKIHAIREVLPEPTLYGAEKADVSFIWWGSSKNPVLDVLNEYTTLWDKPYINYLHFEYMYPLQTTKIQEFLEKNPHACILENNATGQLHELLKKESISINNIWLKYDGRPFFVEEVKQKIEELMNH